jgi:hypothetical protein
MWPNGRSRRVGCRSVAVGNRAARAPVELLVTTDQRLGVRWAIGVAVAVAVIVLLFTGLHGGAASCPASYVSPTASFVGTVLAEHGADIDYRIETMLPGRIFEGGAGAPSVHPGQRVTVTYTGGDARFVHVGHRYRVDVFGSAHDRLTSGVRTAGECLNAAEGVGTFHADGSAIDTGLLTRDGISPYLARVGVAVAATVALVAGGIAYARVRHPRLTIDGRRRR